MQGHWSRYIQLVQAMAKLFLMSNKLIGLRQSQSKYIAKEYVQVLLVFILARCN